jgi:hypothetical protein
MEDEEAQRTILGGPGAALGKTWLLRQASSRTLGGDSWLLITSSCQPSRADGGLLGLIEYYDAVLRKDSMSDREADFRASKLGLVVDLVRMIDISESLKAELTSAIVDAWRLQVPEVTQEQRAGERENLLKGIEGIKNEVAWPANHMEISHQKKLDLALRFTMMLEPSDFKPEAMARINGLIRKAVIYLGKPNAYNSMAFYT